MSLGISSIGEDLPSIPASYSQWPIDPKTEIRILELLPPASPDPARIYCNLSTAKLSDQPAYEALSYAWGETVYSERINLLTGYLAITSNLAAALRQLRHQDRPRRLWVDAVCINQSDDTEKGHQVMLMARIYSQTTRAIGWLGEGNAQTTTAINIIRDLASRSWRFGITASFHPMRGGNGEGVKKALQDLLGELDFQALKVFFTQAWFSRLWIVQEACLPSEIILCNGTDVLTFEDFYVSTAVLIYGLLGLKHVDDPIEILANYDCSVEEVYRDFSLSHLQKGMMKVLHNAGIGNVNPLNCGRTSNLPTWVTDWMSPQSSFMEEELHKKTFGAATMLLPRLFIKQDTLPFIGVSGTQIDIIEEDISTLSPDSESSRATWARVPERIVSIKRQLTLKQPYLTGKDTEMAFYRTLVIDLRGSRFKTYIEDRQDLERSWTELEYAINHEHQLVLEGNTGPERLLRTVRLAVVEQNFLITRTGYFGIGPLYTRPGDSVVVFDGDTTPFVLRRIKLENHSLDSNEEGSTEGRFFPDEQYQLIGDCYIHGFMDNEAVAPEWRAKQRLFGSDESAGSINTSATWLHKQRKQKRRRHESRA